MTKFPPESKTALKMIKNKYEQLLNNMNLILNELEKRGYIERKMKFKRFEMDSSKTYIDCLKGPKEIIFLRESFEQVRFLNDHSAPSVGEMIFAIPPIIDTQAPISDVIATRSCLVL